MVATVPLLTLLPLSSPADDPQVLSLPPQSLSQWYKPANKRQVWLHNMFKLRREMLAVSDYLEAGDLEQVVPWAARLLEHYRKIGDMVPEWRDALDLDWARRLEEAVAKGEQSAIARAVRKIRQSCRDCHQDYRATVAVLMRAPDFSKVMVHQAQDDVEIPYDKAMQALSAAINRIIIANTDHRSAAAAQAIQSLTVKLTDLAGSCGSCHDQAIQRQRLLGASTDELLLELQQEVAAKNQTAVGRSLGSLAVNVCANCHSVHRAASDLRNVLLNAW